MRFWVAVVRWIRLNPLTDQDPACLTQDAGQRHRWLAETPQHRFARATVAFVDGDYAGSLALLENNARVAARIAVARHLKKFGQS